MTTTNKKDGFTLVELAIVIVIIGFLVAGIAAGSNMIKQAELRSLVTDLQAYQTAYNNFLGRYNKVAGDMDVASAYFPNCAATGANCNGNGDGVIDHTAVLGTNETRGAWRHLSEAGMIGAGISVIADLETLPGSLDIGTRAPSSKKSGAGFMMVAGNFALLGNAGGTASVFADATNAVMIGTAVASAGLAGGALTAEEAFNIDQKLDDGLVTGTTFSGADTGVIRVQDGNGATATACVLTAATYDIDNVESACVLGLALN